MLTEQEQEWLRDRPAYTSIPLSKYDHWYQYFEHKCREWAETNYETAGWFDVLYRGGMNDDALYKDAAEFEARVAAKLAQNQITVYRAGKYSYDYDPPDTSIELKRARLSIEEGM